MSPVNEPFRMAPMLKGSKRFVFTVPDDDYDELRGLLSGSETFKSYLKKEGIVFDPLPPRDDTSKPTHVTLRASDSDHYEIMKMMATTQISMSTMGREMVSKLLTKSRSGNLSKSRA